MTVVCPEATYNTLSIDQPSITVPDLLNKGTVSDISLNGGSPITASAKNGFADLPSDCVDVTWSVAEDSTTLET